MILYGVSAEVSIGELFIAGLVTGPADRLRADAVRVGVLQDGRAGARTTATAAWAWARPPVQASWALLMPVIILGGIYGGIFTPTEASAVAVFYALFVGLVIYREIKPHRPVCARRAQIGDVSSAVIMFIIANAGLFAFLITRAGVPEAIGGWLERGAAESVLLTSCWG
jgi:C4-dicarboxylate transporter DctM subunit